MLAGGPNLLALLRTVPNAKRMRRRTDPATQQIAVARGTYRDHVLCAVSVATFLVVLLVAAH